MLTFVTRYLDPLENHLHYMKGMLVRLYRYYLYLVRWQTLILWEPMGKWRALILIKQKVGWKLRYLNLSTGYSKCNMTLLISICPIEQYTRLITAFWKVFAQDWMKSEKLKFIISYISFSYTYEFNNASCLIPSITF